MILISQMKIKICYLISDENNNIDNSENDEGIFDEYLFGKFEFEDYIKRLEYFKKQNKYIQGYNYNTYSENEESSNEKMDLFLRKKIINEENWQIFE